MKIIKEAIRKTFWCLYRLFYRFIPDRIVVRVMYYQTFRRLPNIRRPERYNDKIQWYKLYGGLENLHEYVDKYTVREHVARIIGERYLIPLIGVWESVDAIDFARLPDRFVLKATHGSGYNIVCSDKSKLDHRATMTTLKKWMNENFYDVNRERQYKRCTPRIIAEQYIEDSDGELIDYKIYCFDGVPLYIHVDLDRFTHHTRAFYDADWKRLPFSTLYPIASRETPRPANLGELLDLSRMLSGGVPHVRVDFYNVDGRIYFGELTYTHGNGYEPFTPDEWDFEMGRKFTLRTIAV
ncbi:MAG: glycosyl transferase [Spirochaetes bacterium]|nr:glycosyl transferase [Spirochaetota bacterium]